MTDEWFKTFPPATSDEIEKFAAGTHIPQLAAVAAYSRRTGIAKGPTLMFFQWLLLQM